MSKRLDTGDPGVKGARQVMPFHRSSTPRRTGYAVAIENRAKAIQEALGVYAYDAALERVDQIRTFADHLEREIKAEKAANPPAPWTLVPSFLTEFFRGGS